MATLTNSNTNIYNINFYVEKATDIDGDLFTTKIDDIEYKEYKPIRSFKLGNVFTFIFSIVTDTEEIPESNYPTLKLGENENKVYLYPKIKIKITSASGYKFTKLEFHGSNFSEEPILLESINDKGKVTYEDSTLTWSGSSTSSVELVTNDNWNFESLRITYLTNITTSRPTIDDVVTNKDPFVNIGSEDSPFYNTFYNKTLKMVISNVNYDKLVYDFKNENLPDNLKNSLIISVTNPFYSVHQTNLQEKTNQIILIDNDKYPYLLSSTKTVNESNDLENQVKVILNWISDFTLLGESYVRENYADILNKIKQ